MQGASSTLETLGFAAVTSDRLADLDRFSEAHGKFRYCSCMRWRMRSSEFSHSSKDERVAALESLVRAGIPVGILGYVDGEPMAWCSVAPRETYQRLEHYSKLPRIDDEPVWSVVCFFVDSRYRRRGVTTMLLQAAVDYALGSGAAAVEAYPVEPDSKSYRYMGSPAWYERAGFRDVTPPGYARRVMRRTSGRTDLGTGASSRASEGRTPRSARASEK